jgi:hypothetical protein
MLPVQYIMGVVTYCPENIYYTVVLHMFPDGSEIKIYKKSKRVQLSQIYKLQILGCSLSKTK